MSIDNLPDDCLLYIFNFFNEFEILLNCSRVCERWKYLIRQRISNVKYLTAAAYLASYPVDHTISYDKLDQIEISEWFPKLKILEAQGDADFFSHLSIEGLQLSSYYGTFQNFPFNPSLKMLAVPRVYDFFANDIQGPMLNQLHLSNCSISQFVKVAKYFPNLKRLHLEHATLDDFTDDFYTGPVFKHLEILEINFQTQWGADYDYHGFSLADHCPVLKSAYHLIDRDYEFFANSSIKNHNLENLVIQTRYYDPSWSHFRPVLSKYPNLKHLAIRSKYDTGITNENIAEILDLLPNITLIDIRNSIKVDESSTEFIDRYCKKHNRSISLYYQKRPKITKKWPHLLTKRTNIGRGLDFMKYCFLQIELRSPYLLDLDI